jgi:hypothetical protein
MGYQVVVRPGFFNIRKNTLPYATDVEVHPKQLSERSVSARHWISPILEHLLDEIQKLAWFVIRSDQE